jgi:hypothetical protein
LTINNIEIFNIFQGDIQTLNNDSFYIFFQNITQLNGYKGFVGYGIRELNSSEIDHYCLKYNTPTSLPLIQSQVNFTNDFLIRTYTSGCYFYDSNTGKWLANGMALFKDTNIQQTHCSSNHLTLFAGGLHVMPNKINFEYVFANASFAKNYTIYFTLIAFVILYILFALWAIYMDRQDLRKIKVIPLKDNVESDNYFYELIVFTGNCKESGTHSNVFFILIHLMKFNEIKSSFFLH